MGRPLIDVELYIDKLIQALLVGATYELAALYAGISKNTFIRWRHKAEKAAPGTPLARLKERMEEAEGRAAIGWLAKIEKAASEGNWNAAAWKLERRYPETYGRTFQKHSFTDASGEESAPVVFQVVYQQTPPRPPALLPEAVIDVPRQEPE